MFKPTLNFNGTKAKTAPNCNCWWDIHSECTYVGGCITADWTKIKI